MLQYGNLPTLLIYEKLTKQNAGLVEPELNEKQVQYLYMKAKEMQDFMNQFDVKPTPAIEPEKEAQNNQDVAMESSSQISESTPNDPKAKNNKNKELQEFKKEMKPHNTYIFECWHCFN